MFVLMAQRRYFDLIFRKKKCFKPKKNSWTSAVQIKRGKT
jgi:hypothetical protein